MARRTNLATLPRTPGAVSATALYLDEISRYDLLDRDQEQHLARLIQEGKAAAARLNDGARLNPVERRRLIKARDAGTEARDTLISSNLRLVVAIAKRYAKPGLDLLDVVSEGNIGLIKAADSFQAGHGTKFSTWATLWVKQAVERGSHAVERAIRLPAGVIEDAHRCIRASTDLAQRLGRHPTTAEIAAETGVPEPRVLDALNLRHPSSLDAPIGDDDGASLAEVVPSTGPSLDEVTAGQVAVDQLDETLNVLTPEEREVLTRRLGFVGNGESSVASVAEALGVSRERVRHCEMRALAKLRHPRYRIR